MMTAFAWLGQPPLGIAAPIQVNPAGPPGPAGRDGAGGAPGAPGLTGAAGVNGVGIAQIYFNAANHLIVSLTDGTATDLGAVASSGGVSSDSPRFTGTPTAPTASAADNSTTIASTAFVATAVNAETSRAQTAEAAAADAISTEINRAQSAEQANATAISQEATRAKAAEQTTANGLSGEISRAQASEGVLTQGTGLTIPALGGDPTGVADSTAAFTAAANSTSPHPTRLTSGTYTLGAGTFLGDRLIIAEPGAQLRKPDGTVSDAHRTGGLQIAADLDTLVAVASGTFVHPFMRVRYTSGQSTASNVAALSANILFHNKRVASGNAYEVPAVVNYANIQYGIASPASGSAGLYGGAIYAGAVAAEASGRSELTPITAFVVCDPSQDQNNVNAYMDTGVSGPVTKQEAFIGSVFHGQKRNPGTTLDANHNGAYGLVASTAPGGAGYATPAMSAATTYPLIALVSAAGFSGPQGTADGTSSGATDGAQYAFFGGGGGSVWLNANGGRSRFQYGLGLTDWRDAAISIPAGSRHPSGTGVGINSAYPIVAPNFTVDGNFYQQILGGNPAVVWNPATISYYDRSAQAYTWLINSQTRMVLSLNSLSPGVDNAVSLGTASARFTTVYAATATINTSDAAQKTGFRAIDESLLLAALDTPLALFQWKDAVAAKGTDGARWHFGPTAQGFRDACHARGFDPKRFAGYCEDPEIKLVQKTRTVQVPAYDEVDEEPEQETYLDAAGVARVRLLSRKGRRARMIAHPVLDADGQPVVRKGSVRVPDGEEIDAATGRTIPKYRMEETSAPVIHYEPVVQDETETYEVEEVTGATVFGLRLDQFDRVLSHARWLVSTGRLAWTPAAS